MRNILIILCLMPLSAYCRPDSVRRSINLEPELIHHVVLHSTSSNTTDQFNSAFQQRAQELNLNFTTYNSIEERPDVVLILDDYKNGYQKAIENQAIPVFIKGQNSTLPQIEEYVAVIKASNNDQIVSKGLKFMQHLYYSGERPRYTAVFKPNTDGYFAYRIPAVTILPDGRILAFAEGRQEGRSDCADNDIVMKYSDDKGESWSKLILVAKSRDNASYNNPTVVSIEENNEVIVLFQKYPNELHEGLTELGFESANTVRINVVKSSDNGANWSQPKDISKELKRSNVSDLASGPGAAIRVVSGANKGRILVPFNASGGEFGWYNYLGYSDDLGATWGIISGRSQYGTNESQVVQIGDNELLINARSHRFVGDEDLAPSGWNPWNFDNIPRYRGAVNVSIDGTEGEWSKTKNCTDLLDPQCQGGIARHSGLIDKEPSILIFTNPASNLASKRSTPPYSTAPPKRINGTLSISLDEGETWPIKKRFFGNRYTEFQYSQPVRISKNQIGIIFETGVDINFAMIDINWITSGYNLKALSEFLPGGAVCSR